MTDNSSRRPATNTVDSPMRIAEDVARAIREAVYNCLDDPESSEATGVASSGDTTFAVDLIAEKSLEKALTSLDAAVACYSEDEGLKPYHSNPEWLLIVDPIDGTRPAASGLNACAVSVAVARMTSDACMSDVVAGAVYELHRDRLYVGGRDEGSFGIFNGNAPVQLRPKAPREFCELRWTLETVARPALPNFTAAHYLIDETSLRGSIFCLSSSAFSLCQNASGQFSGMVDLSGRLLKDLDPDGIAARVVGHGRVMGLWAYDIAAAALIAAEAGCTVTDAWGNSLDSIPLTRTKPEDMASCICAASPEYHQKMLDLINKGFAELS